MFSLYCGLIGFRKFFSKIDDYEFFPDLDLSGLLTILINLASNPNNLYAQYESMWILSNLATGDERIVDNLAEKGALLLFTMNCDSENEEIQRLGFWALANIICEKQNFRDSLINIGIIDKFKKILKNCGKE